MKIHDDTIKEFIDKKQIKSRKQSGINIWKLTSSDINNLLDYYLVKNYLLNEKMFNEISNLLPQSKTSEKYNIYIDSLKTKLKKWHS